MVYTQLLSMQHLNILGKLTDAHAMAKAQNAASTVGALLLSKGVRREYRDGRRHQTLDGQAQDGAGAGHHSSAADFRPGTVRSSMHEAPRVVEIAQNPYARRDKAGTPENSGDQPASCCMCWSIFAASRRNSFMLMSVTKGALIALGPTEVPPPSYRRKRRFPRQANFLRRQ